MKSASVERPAVGAIPAAETRDVMIAYLSYVLEDVRVLDAKAYQLLQLAVEALGGDRDVAQVH